MFVKQQEQPKHPQPAASPGTRERILDALVEHVSQVGMHKLTMDDIARRAGLSRVTLYAYFQNKHEIVRAAALRELERFLAELERVSGGFPEGEQRLVKTFAHACRYLREHPLVQRMIRSEPELLATYAARETPAIPLAREWVSDKLAQSHTGELSAAEREQAAEVIVRAVHSLVIAPESAFSLDSPSGPERYVERWILPALRAPVTKRPRGAGASARPARRSP
jgi:AcrR family transcriptional regulator